MSTELPRVYDLLEARDWFNLHPCEPIICIRKSDLKELVCENYEEALRLLGSSREREWARSKPQLGP